MQTFTFALVRPNKATEYLDVVRSEDDDRSWREIVIEKAVADGLMTPSEELSASVMAAVRPPAPTAHWR